MSSSTRQNQRNAVSAVHDLLDQLISEVPQKHQAAPHKTTAKRTSKQSARLQRIFATLDDDKR